MKSAYATVTAAYWAFMLSDGALRMLVLLHFHQLGFSALQLAYLFVLYEVAGMVTNLVAGWLAARFGLARTLYAGLLLQIGALLALTLVDPAWSIPFSLVYAMIVQGVGGVAKDLAKMASKSAVKLLAPQEDGGLFRWVALLTGSKNAVKGAGFLLGAMLLGLWGFYAAIWGMTAVLAVILIAVITFMPAGLPASRKGAKFSEVLSKSRRINWLSAARLFLFGARDVWFVVGVPLYFYAVLSDGTPESKRAAFFIIGGFMAVWTILYGIVQAFTPQILRSAKAMPIVAAQKAAWLLASIPALLSLASLTFGPPMLTPIIVLGLLVFGGIFAINSALHSYLILEFSTSERVTMDVGFYYMANAGGRLLGTLLSGLSYQTGGLTLCLGVAAGMLVLSALSVKRLR